MNLKTTLFLVLLVAAGGLGFLIFQKMQPAAPESPTLQFLQDQLTGQDLQRIEVDNGKDPPYVLQRAGNEWTLPGKWPVRKAEVDQLVALLVGLRSRFVPEPLGKDADLKRFGLDNPLTVKVRIGPKDEHVLVFGEEPGAGNRFARSTFLRLDKNDEVVRLGPGLVAALDRRQDYFQQRRLFPTEKVAKDKDDKDAKEKTEQLAAVAIRVQGKDGDFALAKIGDDWEVKNPVRDRTDPEALKGILAGLPDLWAENFVDKKDKKIDGSGLKDPEYTLTVTRPSGATIKLLIGKISDTKERTVIKPGPGGGPFGPQKPIIQNIKEEFRYAKLQDNDQVFEIKGDKLKDLAVALASLRDPQVARFKTGDVTRLEIQHGAETLVFVKDKERWRFEKPKTEDAETGPVTELLDKLAGLQARDKDVLDKADPKTLGLDKPAATIKCVVEEETGDKDKKTKKTRAIVFSFGLKEMSKAKGKEKEDDKKKLFVRVDGWPRINAIDDALLKLVQRPVYAYRNRKLLDMPEADLAKLTVTRGSETFTLEHKGDSWRLAAPVEADVDAGKVAKLAGELTKLEVAEFVSDSPKAEDLDKLYGLAKPALSAVLSFSDAKKPAKTLHLGKQREGKQEYFARLDEGPIFAVKKDLRDELDRDALSYRRLLLWTTAPEKIRELAIQKEGQEYRLLNDGKAWKIAGPFDAPSLPDVAETLSEELVNLRCDRYVAHAAKELAPYGLDKPTLKLRVIPAGKKSEELQVLVGKPVEKEAGRFAKLGKNPAIFVLSDKTVAAFDKTPLEFLEKKVLALNLDAIHEIRSLGATSYALKQKKDAWEVVDSPAPPFAAEKDAVFAMLRPWANLQAERIAAYGPKIDWANFGLSNPSRTVKVTLAKEDKKPPQEHVLALGKDAGAGKVFARLDKQDQVVVLDAPAAAALAKTHLDFVNHKLLHFEFDTVNIITRKMTGGDFELVKRDDNWHFAKPFDRPADDPTVGDILEKTFRLRAQRVAAYPVKELQPFGLDKPAVVTLKLTDFQGRTVELVIKVGNPATDPGKKDSGERYALVDKGEAVVVLPAELSRHLVAPLLHFVDRNLVSFASADKALLERPGRKVAFSRGETAWTMTTPVVTEAEDADLEELLKGLRRFRADEVVAEKGADLKLYGLDRPEAQWKFLSGERDLLHLLVGSADKEGRRYAKLGNKDQVFLLSAKLSARVLDEYRGRKPWPALDAAQVEKISYKGPASFVLQKSDGDWHFAANPEAKVNAKQVTDTLDALAGLKAARYVADAKADMKLYGLDPAVWTIEVQTPTGKRTLLVGRNEGDSQRVYGAVPGTDAVFVIGETEAARIVRPMAGFVEGK